MSGRKGSEAGLPQVLRKHPVAVQAPAVAAELGAALQGHILPMTRGSYSSAVSNYLRFCTLHKIAPWPVDVVWFCGWLLRLATSVSHPSFRVYMAGVKDTHELEGYRWAFGGNELVRRVMRYIKRRYPVKEATKKMPISLGVLKTILPHLPGWPNPEVMSHDDRLFTAASLVAVCAFLRGGEFLSTPQRDRPILTRAHMGVCQVGQAVALVVSVPQPKTTFWLSEVDVPCFSAPPDLTAFCPRRWYETYLRLSPLARASEHSAAFHFRSGAALTRTWMVARTQRLLQVANVRFVDNAGRVLPMKMASWRAGGVRSALDANLPETLIREFGRWKSSAWHAYLLRSCQDLQGASREMWRLSKEVVGGLPVGLFSAGAMFVEEEDRSAEGVGRHV
jgi:hypothetical protein